MKICIFGASSDHLDRIYFDSAYDLGMRIAQSGHTLLFGAGSSGLMGACAKGALQNGGEVIGIAPRLFDEPGFLLRDSTEIIFTETLSERKERMMEACDSIIVLPGGIGTMDEFFEAITLKQLGLLHCPIVLLNTNRFYDPLYCLLQSVAEKGFMSFNCMKLLYICDTPLEAIAAAEMTETLTGSIRRLQDYNQ